MKIYKDLTEITYSEACDLLKLIKIRTEGLKAEIQPCLTPDGVNPLKREFAEKQTLLLNKYYGLTGEIFSIIDDALLNRVDKKQIINESEKKLTYDKHKKTVKKVNKENI